MSGLIKSKTTVFTTTAGVRSLRHPEAAKLAYLGLYALQHGAGIRRRFERRPRIYLKKRWACADIFQLKCSEASRHAG